MSESTESNTFMSMSVSETLSVLWAARRLCELKAPKVPIAEPTSLSHDGLSCESSVVAPLSILPAYLSSSPSPSPSPELPLLTDDDSNFSNSGNASNSDVVFSLQDNDDQDNVNQLHQFVRRDVVEVYVLPGPSAASPAAASAMVAGSSEEASSSLTRTSTPMPNQVCGVVANDEDSDSRASSTKQHFSSKSSIVSHFKQAKRQVKQRAYPGRVGLRCKYCRRAGGTSSSSVKMSTVLPFSVKNLYRAVCRFQTTHFLHCPHVPSSARAKYMSLKSLDKTRGNKKYWVVSAMRKGLMDHPDGIDGIVLDEEKLRRHQDIGHRSF